jgi:hypothetical protein
MNEEYGTINVERQQMMREIDTLKERYLAQRETLRQLETEAPSEELAARYREIQSEIEGAIRKLTELGHPPVTRRTSPSTKIPAVTAPPATIADRPLHGGGIVDHAAPSETPTANAQRLALMVGVALIVLIALAFLVMRGFRNKPRAETRVAETQTATTTTTTTTVAPVTPVVEESGAIGVSPSSHDFGTIRKGTRAVRQFKLENHSDAPVSVAIARSKCRCLWFDFDEKIPAKSSTILAITVDGAKAAAGNLAETVEISNKKDKTEKATIQLSALIE